MHAFRRDSSVSLPVYPVAQNTRFFALSSHFRSRSPPKRHADSAQSRSQTARVFAYFAQFRTRSPPKRHADRAQTRSEPARFFAQPYVDVQSVQSLPPPLRSPNGPFRRPLVNRGETNRAGPARSARSPPADSSRRADLLPPEGVSSGLLKIYDSFSHPPSRGNLNCRHVCTKTTALVDF